MKPETENDNIAKLSKKQKNSLIYQAARDRGATPKKAYSITNLSKRWESHGVCQQEKKYKDMLIKRKHVKTAVDTVMMLAKGKHPGDSGKIVSEKVCLEAAKEVLDRAVPKKTTIEHEVNHEHIFTDVPLEEAKMEHIIDIDSDADIG